MDRHAQAIPDPKTPTTNPGAVPNALDAAALVSHCICGLPLLDSLDTPF
jgi:hypothetical protein